MAQLTLCSKNPSGNRKLSSGGRLIYTTSRPTTKIKNGEVTYAGTCPSSCPLLGKCYANMGHANFQNVRSRDRSDNVTEWILELPKNALVRHLVSGDLVTPNGEIDYEYINEAIEGHRLRPDVHGYAYTHAWKSIDIETVNCLPNFVVNASCESEADSLLALALGWPVARVMPLDSPNVTQNDGFKTVICPNQTKNVTCDNCKLCSVRDRVNGKGEPIAIGFIAHGNNKKSISDIVTFQE